MKKFLILGALILGIVSTKAQTVIDNFRVGPYIVDYIGKGDVNYRLRENVDLYDYFELQRDTTIITHVIEEPVKHAIQLSVKLGTCLKASKEFGISGIWKQKVGRSAYFNGGLSLTFGFVDYAYVSKRTQFEVGIPLQIELGKLNHQRATLYGSFGLTPTIYTTMSAKKWNGKDFEDAPKDRKKAGFLIAPELEFGGNIPLGNLIMRIGIYGDYKINCTTKPYDIYQKESARFFFGGKIGFII